MDTVFNDSRNIEQARFYMIEQQIRPWNVYDSKILQALAKHKREKYVPADKIALAFVDTHIDIGDGQVMLEPRVQARILQDANLQNHETALLVGAGTGYMVALLSSLVKQVIAIEINPRLAQIAQNNLAKQNINNVQVIVGDVNNETILENTSFDCVILAGSIAKIPDNLWRLIKDNGKMIAIVGDQPIMQLNIVQKATNGQHIIGKPWDTSQPRLLNFAENSKFEFN